MQEQHHLLQVFGLFIIMLSFQQHSVFFLVEQYPQTSPLSASTINSRTVLCQFHAKDRLKYNQTVTEKFEQCCKVTDNTVMVVIFTVDVNNEIIEMKYNVPSQKRPCLHANEIGSRSISRLQFRHRVFYGLEFLSGVMDWCTGAEPWVELTGAIFFPRPLSSFGGICNFILSRKKLTKLMFSRHHFSVSLIDFYITSGSVVMPSGHFREYILHLTMASRWPHDIVKPSHIIRINIVCKNYHFVYRS